jgi:hypothetical protein
MARIYRKIKWLPLTRRTGLLLQPSFTGCTSHQLASPQKIGREIYIDLSDCPGTESNDNPVVAMGMDDR